MQRYEEKGQRMINHLAKTIFDGWEKKFLNLRLHLPKMSVEKNEQTTIDKGLSTLFADCLRKNFSLPALSDYGGETFTFGDIANEIARLHFVYKELGLQQGDKIALLGKNAAHWGMVYLSAITYGAVIVPILPDFKANDIHEIVNHSDSELLICEDSIFKTLDHARMPAIKLVLRIKDFSVLSVREDDYQRQFAAAMQAFLQKYPDGIDAEDVKYPTFDSEHLMVISYTSGTTGFSKGVMIPHRSLLGNVLYARNNMPLEAGDRILSFLPLAHTYGCAFEFLFPFTLGCHITFLARIPSPSVIIEAFGKVKPSLILAVPLVVEKIFKTKLLPVISKPSMKILLAIPLLNRILLNKIKAKLYPVFGGAFRELVIGGAAFNPEAEAFFRKMRFPFTVGYGMTECGPLISYRSWKTTELQASGKIVDELEVMIDSRDQQRINGEIMVRGNHVMLGYYKNPEATAQIMDSEGWLHTGDMGTIDEKGNIYIRGRLKSMILGPTGKNVYPEEIEARLNNLALIIESLVVDRDGRPFALIFPDREAAAKAGLDEAALQKVMAEYVSDTNAHMPKYMKIVGFAIQHEEFEKTPKRSIRRFKYQ